MVNGTTSAVQAMIMSVCKAGEKIIMPRNVHRSAINALILCGAEPVYVNPQVEERLGISLGMKVEDVALAIAANPDAKAVLINNPTYYGICSAGDKFNADDERELFIDVEFGYIAAEFGTARARNF